MNNSNEFLSAQTFDQVTTMSGINNGSTLNQNGTLNANQAVAVNLTPTTVSGSTSGSAQFTQPERGTAFQKVIIYLNALVGTASYTYANSFAHTPMVIIDSGASPVPAAVVTSLSTSAVTVTGAAQTGFITLEGW